MKQVPQVVNNKLLILLCDDDRASSPFNSPVSQFDVDFAHNGAYLTRFTAAVQKRRRPLIPYLPYQ